MKYLLVVILLLVSGCAKINPQINPRIDQKIDGQVDDLKNLQNSLNAEIANLRQKNELLNSQVHNLQQGMLNYNHENTGIEIGGGPVVMIFGIITIAMLLIHHYRLQAIQNDKTANILAEQIVKQQNVELENQVWVAALAAKPDIQKNIYKKITANQTKLGVRSV